MLAITASAFELLCSLPSTLHSVPKLHICSRVLPPYILQWLPIAFRIKPSLDSGPASLSRHISPTFVLYLPSSCIQLPEGSGHLSPMGLCLNFSRSLECSFLNSYLSFWCLLGGHCFQEVFPESPEQVRYLSSKHP